MKNTIWRVACCVLLGLTVAAQEFKAIEPAPKMDNMSEQLYRKALDGAFVPVTLETNASGPFLAGPFIELLGSISTATNWGVATFGISGPDHSYGAGAVALYNITRFVATGVGIDWLDGQVTMPSGQVQFQAPLTLGGSVSVRPFAFTGVATPVDIGKGEHSDYGSVVGIFGAGLGVKVYGGFNAFYAIEERSGERGPWHLLGVAFSKAF